MNYGKKMKFSKNGFFLACLLFVAHVVAYQLLIGDIFENFPTRLVFLYLVSCIWPFSCLMSVLADLEDDSEFIFNRTLPGMFLFSPFVYFWVKKER